MGMYQSRSSVIMEANVKSARLFLFLFISVVPLLGQADPPERVGRLGYMSGSVSMQPAGVEDWVPAVRNRPITTGDQVWVDDGARAEIHVGSTALRLGSQTAFQFLNLDNQMMQIRLSAGSLNVHVRYLDDNQSLEVDAPNLAFSILRPGDYRIDAQPDSQTTLVTVGSGNGEITGGGQAFSLHPREQASVTGDQSINYNVYGAPDPDDWDRWCMERGRREEHSPSLRFMHPEMAGYEDLDENGNWRNSPYGQVWVPNNVPDGWAPYHNGHWAWVHPWGWTWVDDAEWGFAPFHYGRWAYWGGNWAWIPGPMAERPVYAPAQVAWIGGPRFGASMSLGAGAVAWVPLGPREAYVPPYQVSPTYLTRVNNSNTVVNNVNVTNIYNTTNGTTVNYVNARAPNAVVAMSPQAMGSAQSVREVSRPVPAAALASAQVMRSAQVAPQLQGVLGPANTSANAPRPPAAVFSHPVVAKTPPPPPPVSFARTQQALQSNPGIPLNLQQAEQIRQISPPSGRTIMVRQAPAAATVVQPQVAPHPPLNAIQVHPGGQPTYAPPAYHPVAPTVQPSYRPPTSTPAQGTPKVTEPASQPNSPTSAPAGQPTYAPPTPHPVTPTVQPTYRPPTSTPAQGTPKVTEPAPTPQPNSPASTPAVQPTHPPVPPPVTTKPTVTPPPPKPEKKPPPPPKNKDKDKDKP